MASNRLSQSEKLGEASDSLFRDSSAVAGHASWIHIIFLKTYSSKVMQSESGGIALIIDDGWEWQPISSWISVDQSETQEGSCKVLF